MCHGSTGRHAQQMNTQHNCRCGCLTTVRAGLSAGKQETSMNNAYECRCPIMLPIEDELRSLEEHRKILQNQIDTIDKKIIGLKSTKEP